MATKEEWGEIAVVLVAAFPNARIADKTLEVYWAALSDLDFQTLNLAATRCLNTCKWFPSIAELREASAQSGERGLQLTAGEAWGLFIRLATIHDNDKPLPENADCPPTVRKTINALGWKYLCASTEGMADRAHFMKTYDAIVRRDQAEAALPPMLRSGNTNPVLAEMSKLTLKLSGGK